MLDTKPINAFIKEVIIERDKVLELLEFDKDNKDLQEKIADWKSGTDVAGFFPVGKTTDLLNELRPRYGCGKAELAWKQAKESVIKANQGEYLLFILDTAYKCHGALLNEAREAYERSSTQLVTLHDHGTALSNLINAVEVYSKKTVKKRAKNKEWLAKVLIAHENDPSLSISELAEIGEVHRSTLYNHETIREVVLPRMERQCKDEKEWLPQALKMLENNPETTYVELEAALPVSIRTMRDNEEFMRYIGTVRAKDNNHPKGNLQNSDKWNSDVEAVLEKPELGQDSRRS